MVRVTPATSASPATSVAPSSAWARKIGRAAVVWSFAGAVSLFAPVGAARFLPAPALDTISTRELPVEGRQVLAAIHAGGPFVSKRDGIVFGNRERVLPRQPRGYYAEYTVPTPGERTRGARRIIAGQGATGDFRTSGEYYYTNDHYETFRRIVR